MTPYDYILIDVANNAGLDKLSYSERISKARVICSMNEEQLKEVYEVADSPKELQNAIQAYKSNDFNHVIGLDAVNQALQIYGVITSDLKTASLASLGVNERTDAYQLIADELNTELNTGIFNRNNCKKALMVTLYGSLNGYLKIIEALKMIDEEELANKLNLEHKEKWFSNLFMSVMKKLAPKAMEAMEVIQELNDEKVGVYCWTLPDGFKVKYDVKSTQSLELKRTSRGGVNFTYSAEHKVYAPSEFNRGMSPNIIHSIDGYIAREMIRRMNGKFISTIHDQFNIKAIDCKEAQKNYNDIMEELNNSDIINDIIKKINPKARTIKKENSLTSEMIKSSSYSIS